MALQFREQKGDIMENERHQLKHPYYFCRVCEGEENKKLWDEVYEYIEHTYALI